jgi:arylsulfatase B/arylsulfatase I/J
MQGCVIVNGQAVDLPRNVSTVAERLGKGGFKTAAFGKWDAGMTSWDHTPTCRGFDYFYGFYGPAQDHFTHRSGALDLRENFEPVRNETGTYSTHLYTEKAQAWITSTQKGEENEKAKTTFVYLAYQAMHAPIEAPPEYVNHPHCRNVTTENHRRM